MSKSGGPPRVPRPGEGKRGEGGYLAYLLRQANAAVRQRLEDGLAPLGLTQPQFAVLTMLRAYGELTGAELARVTVLTPQTVHVITTNLVGRGLIAAGDREGRSIRLAISPAGRRLLTEASRVAAAVESELAAPLSPTAERAVRTWLAHLARLRDDGD